MNTWAIRDPKEADISFIYATWLNSYYSDSHYAYYNNDQARNCVRKTIYFESYRQIIDHILLDAKVKVACKQDDEDVIFGYLVHEPKLIHYCFVKDAFRGLGVAKSLLESADNAFEFECTHLTKRLQPYLRRNKHITFNPYKLYKGI